MDVRCDRCETEYELDDDSVTEGGASVQCTTCGHTFVVGPDGVTIAQIVPTPPGGLADLGPQAADWLLATEDGQTHRFRDLTTLQKWVVERKATREDRVSQRGGPWLPLGEVDELAPFFAVVDQADRARSSDGRAHRRWAVGRRAGVAADADAAGRGFAPRVAPARERRGRGRHALGAHRLGTVAVARPGDVPTRRRARRRPVRDDDALPAQPQHQGCRRRGVRRAGECRRLHRVPARAAGQRPSHRWPRFRRRLHRRRHPSRRSRRRRRPPRRRSPPFRRRRRRPPPRRAIPSPLPRTRRLRPPARSLRSPRRTSGWSARRIA